MSATRPGTTFSDVARARNPEYAKVDPDELDQMVADRLGDDARRPKLLAAVRANLRIRPEVTDQDLYDNLVAGVRHKFRVQTPTQQERTPQEDAAEQRYGVGMKQAATMQGQRLGSQGMTAETFETDQTRNRSEQARRNIPPMEAVEQPEKGVAAIGVRAPVKTYEQVDDWRKFLNIAREHQPDIENGEKPEHRYKIRKLDNTVSLVDTQDADKIVTTLRPFSSYSQAMVPGANVLDRFWEGSDLLQSATKGLRTLHDPSEGSSRGRVTAKNWLRSGYGPAEYARDVGEEIGRESPEVAQLAGDVSALGTVGAMGLGNMDVALENQRLKSTEAWLRKEMAGGKDPVEAVFRASRGVGEIADPSIQEAYSSAVAAKENTTWTPAIQRAAYRQILDAIGDRQGEILHKRSENITLADYLKKATPEQAQEMGKEALPLVADVAANVANMALNAPSEVSLGARAAMSLGRSAPVQRALAGAGRVANKFIPGVDVVSTQPAAWGVPDIPVSANIESPKVSARSMAQAIRHGKASEQLAVEWELNQKFNKAMDAFGVPQAEREALLKRIPAMAEQPELAKAATPVEQALLAEYRPAKSDLIWQEMVRQGLRRDYSAEAIAARKAHEQAVKAATESAGPEAVKEAELAQEWANRMRTGETPVSVFGAAKEAAKRGEPVLEQYSKASDYLAASSERARGAAEDVIKELAKKSRAGVAQFIGKEGVAAPEVGTLQDKLIDAAMKNRRVPKDYRPWIKLEINKNLNEESRGLGVAHTMTPVGKGDTMGAYKEGRFAHLLAGEQAGKADRTIGRAEKAALPLADRMAEAQTRTGERLLRVYQRQMMREADKVLDEAGITDKYARRQAKQEMLFRLAQDAPPKAQIGAETFAKWLTDAPSAKRAETALALEKAPIKGENPYHPVYGQNPALRGGGVESDLARSVEHGGVRPDQFDELYSPGAGKPATMEGVPGFAQMETADLERQVPLTAKTREDYAAARRLHEMNQGATAAQAEKNIQKKLGLSPVAELSQSHVSIQELGGEYKRAAARHAAAWHDRASKFQEATPKTREYYPSLQALEAELKVSDVPRSKLRTTYGQMRDEGEAVNLAVEHAMSPAGKNLVVLRVEGRPLELPAFLQAGKGSERVVELPKGMEDLHGRIVPEMLGKAYSQAAVPKHGEFVQKAKALNNLLGMSQLKGIMTVGRLGFSQRNETSDFIKAAMDEGPFKVFGRDNISLWAAMSKASPDALFQVGNKYVTRRQLFTELGLGRGFNDALRKEAVPEAGDLVAESMRVLGVEPSINPRKYRAASRIANARNTAAEWATAPAQAYEKGVTRRATWGTTGIDPMYSGSDNIRMLLALAKVRRGMSLERAGLETSRMLLDYSNKSPLGQTVESVGVVPFYSYFSSVPESLFVLAAKNPRGFQRINELSKHLEQTDMAMDERGAYDPRIKPLASRVAMMPMVSVGDRLMVPSWENPATELGNLVGAAAEGGDGSVGGADIMRGLGKYVGPVVTEPYWWLTGRDFSTGRPALPVPMDPANYDKMFGGSPFLNLDELKQANARQMEQGGASWFGAPLMVGGQDIKPELTLALKTLKPALPSFAQELAAQAFDVAYSPQRDPAEDQRGRLMRFLAKSLTGTGAFPVSSVRQKTSKERQWAPAQPLDKSTGRAMRTGKTMEAP